MKANSDSSARRPEEYGVFALVFLGFVAGGTGVIISSPGTAATGGILALLALGYFLTGDPALD